MLNGVPTGHDAGFVVGHELAKLLSGEPLIGAEIDLLPADLDVLGLVLFTKPRLRRAHENGLHENIGFRKAEFPAFSLHFMQGIGKRSLNMPLFLVGLRGFEPPTSASRTQRSSQAELQPDSCRA